MEKGQVIYKFDLIWFGLVFESSYIWFLVAYSGQ